MSESEDDAQKRAIFFPTTGGRSGFSRILSNADQKTFRLRFDNKQETLADLETDIREFVRGDLGQILGQEILGQLYLTHHFHKGDSCKLALLDIFATRSSSHHRLRYLTETNLPSHGDRVLWLSGDIEFDADATSTLGENDQLIYRIAAVSGIEEKILHSADLWRWSIENKQVIHIYLPEANTDAKTSAGEPPVDEASVREQIIRSIADQNSEEFSNEKLAAWVTSFITVNFVGTTDQFLDQEELVQPSIDPDGPEEAPEDDVAAEEDDPTPPDGVSMDEEVTGGRSAVPDGQKENDTASSDGPSESPESPGDREGRAGDQPVDKNETSGRELRISKQDRIQANQPPDPPGPGQPPKKDEAEEGEEKKDAPLWRFRYWFAFIGLLIALIVYRQELVDYFCHQFGDYCENDLLEDDSEDEKEKEREKKKKKDFPSRVPISIGTVSTIHRGCPPRYYRDQNWKDARINELPPAAGTIYLRRICGIYISLPAATSATSVHALILGPGEGNSGFVPLKGPQIGRNSSIISTRRPGPDGLAAQVYAAGRYRVVSVASMRTGQSWVVNLRNEIKLRTSAEEIRALERKYSVGITVQDYTFSLADN